MNLISRLGRLEQRYSSNDVEPVVVPIAENVRRYLEALLRDRGWPDERIDAELAPQLLPGNDTWAEIPASLRERIVAACSVTRFECGRVYADLLNAEPEEARASMRALAKLDLYFLLGVLLRRDVGHDWVYARIREVEAEPDWCLDLWARGHFKTTIITTGLSIQEILRNPEIRILILSYNRPSAKRFVWPIKREFEGNSDLKQLFPDTLWHNPREAPRWSDDDGLVVKRTGNPKEPTIVGFGLIDGQPVGMHPDLVVYDDVVTRDTISDGMIPKTTRAWQDSMALGVGQARRRMAGTTWHFADTYTEVEKSGQFKVRRHPARADDGEPVLLTEEALAEAYRTMGPAVYAAQMNLNPLTESELGFSSLSICYYRDHRDGHGMNLYLLVDPAHSRKKDSSYTAICLVGLGGDGKYYWLDGLRDRLGLDDRIKAVFAIHQSWKQRIGPHRQITVGYECYGTQASDVEQIEREMERWNYRFTIIPLRGRENKNDRIQLLEPDYKEHRWFWPERLPKVRKSGETYDLVQEFRDQEFLAWPFSRQPDMLDAMSRIYDPALGAVWPKPQEFATADRYDDDDTWNAASPWAA